MVVELKITISNISMTILLLIGVMILFSSFKKEQKTLFWPKIQDFAKKKESALTIRSTAMAQMDMSYAANGHEDWISQVISFFFYYL